MDERPCAMRTHSDSTPGESLITKKYGVPKRFGLATILLGTSMFAIFFGVMMWLAASVSFIVVSASLLACVAPAQMVVQRAPRLASAVTGMIVLPTACAIVIAIDRNLGNVDSEDLIILLLFWALVGCPAGYIAGILVASVFLVSDYILRALAQLKSLDRRSK